MTFELGTDGPTVIVVGVDGSPTSMHAGAYAAGLCRRQGSLLVVVHVLSSGALGGPAAGLAMDALEEVEQDLRQQVDEQSAHLGIRAQFVSRRGDPFNEIVAVCEEVQAEAVVVGASAGRGHRLVGSLAVRLVKAGRWPVTVVP